MELTNKYTGRELRITGHIYGQPDVEYILIEEKGYCNSQIARSFNRAEIETLKSLLEAK
jgi:hypothetical protein